MRLRPLVLALLIPVLALPASAASRRSGGPIKGAKQAKAIAEQETGGRAVSARRIPLNGASGGWEVDVRVPGEAKGWRCVIDSDTHMVHSKTRIDLPGKKGQGDGPVKVVKGTR